MEVYQKGEIAKKILILAAVGGALAVVCVLPGMAILFKAFDARTSQERYRVKRAVKQMEKGGLLMRKIQNGKEELVLTDQGKDKVWSYLEENLQIVKQKKWDKRWRVLMFDIPETKGKIRREVSWKIKDIGMKAIQNSVFISPFPCQKEIEKIASHYNVQKHFIYFEADTVVTEQNLLQHFELK